MPPRRRVVVVDDKKLAFFWHVWYHAIMTYEKFLIEVQSLGINVPDPAKVKPKAHRRWLSDVEYSAYSDVQLWSKSKLEGAERVPALTNAWSTGGMSGGSCWNDNPPHHYSNDEPIPQWTTLDNLLEKFCPNITFLKYKSLMTLVKTESWTDYEYYGNSTDYTMMVLTLPDLWQFLNDNNLLT